MPASTLHKSAQQEAPNAYISMCKSTTQDTRVQENAHVDARPRRCPRLLLLARVQEDAHVYCFWRASKRMSASTSSLACVQEMPTSTSMRAKMRASPATCAPKMAASEAVTGIATWSRCLRSSSHVLPHDEERREGWLRL